MPEIVGQSVEGNTVTLTFDQPLRRNDQLQEFETAGSDGRFQNATARAEGNTIVIISTVANPVSIRHAWKDNPLRLNAYAESGLPVGPFELRLK